MRYTSLFAIVAILLVTAGCAHEHPYLYPNSTLAGGGSGQAQQAIDTCEALAKRNGLGYGKGRIATSTAKQGAVGAASGAAVGAIFGNAGKGAAVGAANGAVHGLFSGLFSSGRPNPVYRNFVNQCLRNRGYQPIGWK